MSSHSRYIAGGAHVGKAAALIVVILSTLASCGRPETGSAVLIGEIVGDPGEVVVLSYQPGRLVEYLYPAVTRDDAGAEAGQPTVWNSNQSTGGSSQSGTNLPNQPINDGLPDGSAGSSSQSISRFEQTIEDVTGFVDLVASVGGREFGARINAGDTLRMHFTVNENGCEVSYDGANELESRIWTEFYDTYGYWGLYNIKPDPDPEMSVEDAIALLERNDAAFRASLAEKVSAKDSRYYIHRADLAHNLLKAILLESLAERDGIDPNSILGYGELMDIVDPNDPEAITFPLIYRWALHDMDIHAGSQSGQPSAGDQQNQQNQPSAGDQQNQQNQPSTDDQQNQQNQPSAGDQQNQQTQQNPAVEQLGRFIAFMDRNDRRISRAESRKTLASWMAGYCCSSIDLEAIDSYEPFITRLESFYPEGTDLVESCRNSLNAAMNSLPGSPVPDVEMLTPDGGKVALSSLFGKVLYIDMWATWCGPCLKEGPYFQKLAEQYKDDGRICFISISVDSTDEPWLEFLGKEQPFWPQFRLSEEADKDFSGKVGIHAIPRFLLIGPDGRFINSDAARPSDESTAKLLENILE